MLVDLCGVVAVSLLVIILIWAVLVSEYGNLYRGDRASDSESPPETPDFPPLPADLTGVLDSEESRLAREIGEADRNVAEEGKSMGLEIPLQDLRPKVREMRRAIEVIRNRSGLERTVAFIEKPLFRKSLVERGFATLPELDEAFCFLLPWFEARIRSVLALGEAWGVADANTLQRLIGELPIKGFHVFVWKRR